MWQRNPKPVKPKDNRKEVRIVSGIPFLFPPFLSLSAAPSAWKALPAEAKAKSFPPFLSITLALALRPLPLHSQQKPKQKAKANSRGKNVKKSGNFEKIQKNLHPTSNPHECWHIWIWNDACSTVQLLG